MMPRKDATGSSSSVKYHRMAKSHHDGFVDMQFDAPPAKIPYKAISLAAVLFIGGSMLIVMGSLLLAGVIDTKFSDRSWPLLILGSLMFIPGAYHINIAYNAWKGNAGYSYQDIPDVD